MKAKQKTKKAKKTLNNKIQSKPRQSKVKCIKTKQNTTCKHAVSRQIAFGYPWIANKFFKNYIYWIYIDRYL